MFENKPFLNFYYVNISEKLFPSSVRTVKPILAVAPSSSKPLAKPVLHRPAEVRYNGKTDMTVIFQTNLIHYSYESLVETFTGI